MARVDPISVWPPGSSTEPDAYDFGALEEILSVMPTDPAPPPNSFRARLANAIESAACKLFCIGAKLATAIRHGGD